MEPIQQQITFKPSDDSNTSSNSTPEKRKNVSSIVDGGVIGGILGVVLLDPLQVIQTTRLRNNQLQNTENLALIFPFAHQ
ncbi:10156_t:CDS:2 [Ambispora gerdemannii]|uniref:10156_t:CDS:1 n=1 Tax=Ambispora gerdemannii TaxID=144530 RepID=A0A9N9F0Y7_9GLOM|nr:10156_t:CDS:2 [Ambispora gerdemannii]